MTDFRCRVKKRVFWCFWKKWVFVGSVIFSFRVKSGENVNSGLECRMRYSGQMEVSGCGEKPGFHVILVKTEFQEADPGEIQT